MIKSGYNFAYVTTTELSGYVQTYDMLGTLES